MIDKKFVNEKVLPLLKDKGRLIDVLLIQNMFENKGLEIVEELRKYQNKDLGLGNALEPDLRMPNSSVVATNMGVKILNEVKDDSVKEKLIEELVTFYENSYNSEKERFLMTTKEVDDYPHAVWWNYVDLEKNFPFGNPDPEVIGFLYKYRRFVTKLDLNHLVNNVIAFIKSDEFLQSGMHILMSVLTFNNYMDKDIQNLIHDRLHLLVDQEIKKGLGKWEEYSLEPYKIYIIDSHFTEDHLSDLEDNLEILLDKVKTLSVKPNWNWYQYEDVFEKTKFDWLGHIYFDMIKALRYHRN